MAQNVEICQSSGDEYICIRQSMLHHYRMTALYYQTRNEFSLYKEAGRPLGELHEQVANHPTLYIRRDDKIRAIGELQTGLTSELKELVHTDKVEQIKSTLVTFASETLSEPRSGLLGATPDIVNLAVEGFQDNREVFKTLAFLSDKDYTTAMHSVNVMALTIGYSTYVGESIDSISDLGLMALLHDVGKCDIPDEILKSDARLSPEEFQVMKSHPEIGEIIIRNDPGIDTHLALAAIQHHEKLDGSGYPYGLRNISYAGQLVGIIDCYEALTGDERPYRRAKAPLATLELIKGEVESGKLNAKIFQEFAKSLV